MLGFVTLGKALPPCLLYSPVLFWDLSKSVVFYRFYPKNERSRLQFKTTYVTSLLNKMVKILGTKQPLNSRIFWHQHLKNTRHSPSLLQSEKSKWQLSKRKSNGVAHKETYGWRPTNIDNVEVLKVDLHEFLPLKIYLHT